MTKQVVVVLTLILAALLQAVVEEVWFLGDIVTLVVLVPTWMMVVDVLHACARRLSVVMVALVVMMVVVLVAAMARVIAALVATDLDAIVLQTGVVVVADFVVSELVFAIPLTLAVRAKA